MIVLIKDACHVGTRSLHFPWLFGGQNSRKITGKAYTMTQIASVLAVATVLLVVLYIQRKIFSERQFSYIVRVLTWRA